MFLAPLLAIAVYFLLTIVGLGGSTAVYTLGVVSFSIGLVTDEVIRTLIRFTKSKLGDTEEALLPRNGARETKADEGQKGQSESAEEVQT